MRRQKPKKTTIKMTIETNSFILGVFIGIVIAMMGSLLIKSSEE